MVGGDELTYKKMLLLKKYLQTHEHKFDSFELMELELEIWHTQETDCSCIFKTHWGCSLRIYPSMLGHSARKMAWDKPASLKK